MDIAFSPNSFLVRTWRSFPICGCYDSSFEFLLAPQPSNFMWKPRPRCSDLCPLLQPQGGAESTARRGMFWAESFLPLLHSMVTDSTRCEDGSAVPGRLKALRGGCCDYYLALIPILYLNLAPAGMNRSNWPKHATPKLLLPLCVLVLF